jgi:hypothetical protein
VRFSDTSRFPHGVGVPAASQTTNAVLTQRVSGRKVAT